ncbi:MAG: SRPBCC family protein [Burkholderiales bacterium]|nr:SRPBCC family protein [Burkholderiales bacterium]
MAAVVAVLIAILLGYAATKPDTFRVQRAISIKAPPEKIFVLINDLRSWTSWSPYERRDPAMKRSHSGAPSGEGAVYEWEGDSQVGTGRMEIIESVPSSRVVLKLDFLKPFEAHNIAEFTLASDGDATEVTWAIHGPTTFVSKVMSVFVSMDKMIGKDFEAGLVSLKAVAEK